MSELSGGLWRNLIAIQIYGANTGVGKTVASTLLGAHFANRKKSTKYNIHYIKPVSTGPNSDRDDNYVKLYARQPTVSTLFQFDDPVSPHVAARRFGHVPTDGAVLARLNAELDKIAHATPKQQGFKDITFVETAGGVLSPGPSGTPQADIYRPLRLPVVLIGDHRLGGIASTISAAESLLMRGYDIDAVVCFNDDSTFENAQYLQQYFDKLGVGAFQLPWIPKLEGVSREEETHKMKQYYDTNSRQEGASLLGDRIINRHMDRLKNMSTMASRTQSAVWHPFTQHKHIEKADDILVFDSAYGDFFQAKHTAKSDGSLLYPAFDGSASWWTQGLGHGNPQLSLAAAYAAGRYGHVMFAGATHEPALTLAERLLKDIGNPRLTKVFYTDNGSTALEVGIKMGLRAACKRYDWDGSQENIGVLGLKGSYHGDTIGAMDASEPCVYNKKVDWYRGRGYWFDFPTVKMTQGRWVVEPPAGMENDFGSAQSFDSLDEVFDFQSRTSRQKYEQYITSVLDDLVGTQGRKFGTLLMEPIILGAGGMLFVDPLFQRTLVDVVRKYTFSPTSSPIPEDQATWTGLPVVFDEVFTGLYRLGRYTAASFLDVHPDITCNAKLLTGGLLPLSVTVASSSIFEAFWGDEKSDALLHGHSYTAHAIGCHVANTSLSEMDNLHRGAEWRAYKEAWGREAGVERDGRVNSGSEREAASWSMWSKDTVTELSNHARVEGVIALGSVLAVTLKDLAGSGYTSTAALSLRDDLLSGGDEDIRIHSRVLGNVLYLMASMTSKRDDLRAIEKVLLRKLDEVS
ncbi:PLP-dependent transferase [Aaosphaeria arxii CBS 175.79]|uniref:PLP-dependent transferase n=1 Tax=Aaosphaeria arxii CBS 175.79 TaxID=1450172 RepID=A0A6A5XAU9_9PLEO|nr:PLP-dependent transferase [Aaosphaeria arxii CBS 175.79]KAF2009966.1 PLP-dependent transferase [Aaosphaeria arxii CBS 175.79]